MCIPSSFHCVPSSLWDPTLCCGKELERYARCCSWCKHTRRKSFYLISMFHRRRHFGMVIYSSPRLTWEVTSRVSRQEFFVRIFQSILQLTRLLLMSFWRIWMQL